MVTTKFVVLALVAFLASQVSGNRIQTVNDDADDAIEQSAKLLHLVTDVINKAIDFNTNIVKTLIKDFQQIHDNAQEYAKSLIDAELKVLNTLIDSVKKDTTATVANIFQCVEDVEKDLAEVQTLVLVNAATCSNGSVLVLLHDAEQILDGFSQVNQKVDAQADALKKCEGQSSPASCVKGIVGDLVNIVNQIPADLKDAVSKIEADFKNVAEIVTKCTKDAIPKFIEKAKVLENDFVKCIG